MRGDAAVSLLVASVPVSVVATAVAWVSAGAAATDG
jgi:hypothetical protein